MQEYYKNEINQLVSNLEVLRAAAKLTQQELADYMGMSRVTYVNIISRNAQLQWRNYLALIFFFDINQKTHLMLHRLGIYPSRFVKDINQASPKECS